MLAAMEASQLLRRILRANRPSLGLVQRLSRRHASTTVVTELEHRDDGAFERYLPMPKTGGFARGSFVAWRRAERVRDTATVINDIHALYEFQELVGEGGFGKVFAAKHKRTGEVVAIKTLPKDKLKEQEALKLEVAFLKQADHPNTVRYYEAFEDADKIYLVMEMCTGGALSSYIHAAHDNFGPGFSEGEIARIIVQMLQGVAYCHAHSMAHRDIKPGNLLFSCREPGESTRAIPTSCSGNGDAPLKLVDFGIAGVLRNDKPQKRLLTKCAGTVGYMAPEVFEAKPYDGRSADMFSIGAVMHHLITGLPPIWQKDKGAYKFPGRLRCKSLSEDCQSLLEHLLHSEPELRPTAAEALQHPWLNAVGMAEHEGISVTFEKCLQSMHEFSRRSKLQQLIMYSMVAFAPLHNHHMEQLRSAFLAADKGMSSGISCFEFVELGRRYSQLSTKDLRSIFTTANFSRTGKLSYCEWLAAAAPKEWYEKPDHAQRAFETLDAHKKGFLCATDLTQLLPKVLDPVEIESELRSFFPQSNGKLNFQEFCACSEQWVSRQS
eukprot:TRINITY_DN22381_c0_g1_i1.p1 TRINITY_DN22381_c0_g1~~TRINITY_DN22381_c0_g1_i1.p1  ORF type:complete len:551 (-),score=71.64 TRINITY_DN22381_c0_g1_i1:8-1660(-)